MQGLRRPLFAKVASTSPRILHLCGATSPARIPRVRVTRRVTEGGEAQRIMSGAEADGRQEVGGEDTLVGRVVNGRFHIVKRIARGGMGSVYFATQTPLSRPVAVKVLHTVRSGDGESEESFRRRFLQEASILAKLQHPNIVMLLDYGQISNLPTEHYFMAMEFLRGETLAQRFRTRGRLTLVESIRLVRQIGRGLREAHRCGFIHRDLKPSNIMLVPGDERGDIVKLIDFGIGKIIPGKADPVRDSADETQAGLLLGSPRYMSPEQIRSEPVEPRTDLYGLGVTLFEALTGRVPFEGGASFDVMLAHCLIPPPRLSEACPTGAFPAALSDLVGALLEKQPANRPTVDEFLQRLTDVEEEIFRSVTLTMPNSRTFTPVTVPIFAPGHDIRPRDERITLPPASSALGASRHLQTQSLSVRRPIEVAGPAEPSFSSNPPAAPAVTRNTLAQAMAMLAVLALCIPVGRCAIGSVFAHKTTASALSTDRLPLPSAGSGDAARVAPASALPLIQEVAVTVESTPSGATVTRDGEPVGVTPVTLSIDRSTLRAAPLRLVLKLAGYAAATIEQADSDTPVLVSATLVPVSRYRNGGVLAATRAASASTPSSVPPPVMGSTSAKREEAGGLDIRLRR